MVVYNLFLRRGIVSTFFANKKNYTNKKWHVIDAKGQVVGRLAAQISRILSGKTKTDYTPHVETGDGVIVINASEVRVTGAKAGVKAYKFYSGFPKGLREVTFDKMMQINPTYALRHAVKGMLPKSRLGSRMLTHFLVYPGAEHPHSAQKPKLYSSEHKKKVAK